MQTSRKSTISESIIQNAANRYKFWMERYTGHHGTHNEELADWLSCDSGFEMINNYQQFCELALCLHKMGFNTNPPPTENQFNDGADEYKTKHLSHNKSLLKSVIKIEPKIPTPKNEIIPFLDDFISQLNFDHKSINSDWFRIGNFYENILMPLQVDKLVRFRNHAVNKMIKEIEIYRYSNPSKGMIAIFTTTYFKIEELLQHCKDIACRIEEEKIEFKFMTLDQFKELLKLFDKLGSHEIPKEIRKELACIFYRTQNASKQYPHIIAEYKLARSHVNPERKGSIELSKLLEKSYHESKIIIDDYAKILLVKGEDPNQELYRDTGWTPIYVAVNRKNDNLIGLFLVYGANPFTRGHIFFESAFELARKNNNIFALNSIISFFTTPKKSLSYENSTYIKGVHVQSHNDEVETCLYYRDNSVLRIQFKNCSQLGLKKNKQEKQDLFKLFEQYFELSNEKCGMKLHELFAEDLQGKNKFIQTVYSGSQLVGFNLFEIIPSQSKHEPVTLHCIYALMHPNFCGSGLMSFLSFRLAFSLQQVLPKQKVAIFFSAINDNSYRMVNNILHFPKYKADSMSEYVGKIINKVYGPETKHEDGDTMRSYIREPHPIKVKNHKNKKSDLISSFFYKHILDQKEDVAAPIFYYVEKDSVEQLQNLLLPMGINFVDHIRKLASCILPYVKNIIHSDNITSSPYFMDKDMAFWKPPVSDAQRAASLPLLKSKL